MLARQSSLVAHRNDSRSAAQPEKPVLMWTGPEAAVEPVSNQSNCYLFEWAQPVPQERDTYCYTCNQVPKLPVSDSAPGWKLCSFEAA